MTRRSLSARESAAWLAKTLESQAKADRLGAIVVGRGGIPVTVERFDGQIAHLSNGESIHRSRLRLHAGSSR